MNRCMGGSSKVSKSIMDDGISTLPDEILHHILEEVVTTSVLLRRDILTKSSFTVSDRISSMPDDILCHILSFLPSEDAFATTVLSKRWENVCYKICTLDFDESRFGYNRHSSFVKFVNDVLQRRVKGGSQPIQKLSLTCDSFFPEFSDITSWLETAKHCKVESLELEMCRTKVSFVILNTRTLVAIKLHQTSFDAFSSVDLPLLKTLHLDDVRFVNRHYFMELLHGCPILENLDISSILFDDYLFDGEVKTVSKLVRLKDFSDNLSIPLEAFSDVQFLHTNKCAADVPVFSHLTQLEIEGSMKWRFVIDLLPRCPNLQTVVFNLDWDDVVWSYSEPAPICFASQLQECVFKIFYGEDSDIGFAKYLLENSPSLRRMTITLSSSSYDQKENEKKLQKITTLSSCVTKSPKCEVKYIH